MTKAAVVAIGSDLFNGGIQDDPGHVISRELRTIGLTTVYRILVPDDEDALKRELTHLGELVDVVIVTGGLAPEAGDVARHAIAEHCGRPLVFREDTWQEIEANLRARGVSGDSRRQAWIPDGFSVVENRLGFAPGFMGEADGVLMVSLPDQPRELRAMLLESVLPRLRPHARAGTTVSVYMISESRLEQSLRKSAGVGGAYLRRGEPVDRRGQEPAASVVSGKTAACPQTLWWETRTGEDRIVVVIRGGRLGARDGFARRLRKALGRCRFHEGDIGPAGTVFEVLERNGETIATAESCTGGWISKMLTDIAGSSAVFKGGCVSYSNESKTDLIGVDASIIERHGAVSEQVVKAMARGAARVFAADYGLGISGIAGPSGATPEKPLGTVWIAIAGREHTVAGRCFRFSGSRDSVRRKAAVSALIMARQFASRHGELDIPKTW